MSKSLSDLVKQYESDLKNVATNIRTLSMDAVLKANSGHIGLPLGGADMAVLLYFLALKHDPKNPGWIDRDRFVLSAGHGSMLQYAALHLSGYDLTLKDIEGFRCLGSKTPGHPEFGITPGVECTTGPLGQGLAMAVGKAIAERTLAAKFNDSKSASPLIDHRTYVIAGDGCMMEGVASEACSLAGHLKLNKLVCLYDANNITIDGTIDVSFSEDVGKRFEAYGWDVIQADGHDFHSLACGLDQFLKTSNKEPGQGNPTLIICKTKAGFGSKKWEGKPKVHGNPLTAEDVADVKRELGRDPDQSFTVYPETTQSLKTLRQVELNQTSETWENTLQKTLSSWMAQKDPRAELWASHFAPSDPAVDENSFGSLASDLPESEATRASSGRALNFINQEIPNLFGGSADLAGSNNTTLSGENFIEAINFSGKNIHFGVREHAMGAICNGIALHGGLRPYCATFTVFSDYMRPAIRLAALMKIPSTFVLTHDSFFVGEDGPTHQPVEHAASLRIIPDLNVWRPADAFETYAAWCLAVSEAQKPSALLLTRQKVPNLDHLSTKLGVTGYQTRSFENVISGLRNGAYLLKDFEPRGSERQLTLIASGSEVAATLEAASLIEQKLKDTGSSVSIRVVSCPAPQSLLKNQTKLEELVPGSIKTIAIEAGCSSCWKGIVGRNGAVIAMDRFGESGPAETLAKHFGFSPDGLAEKVLEILEAN